MDLWIRSQDGILLEKAEAIRITDYNGVFGIAINNDYIFGVYITEERAVEVLDEIKRYILLPNIDNSAYVYQMPIE